MKVNAKSIDLAKVQAEAEESYRKGFFCCEAVMSVIRDAFQADVPESVIAMSSGMSIGAGRSGCM
ncbi:MAG: oxidoreductase, partial [Mogibacterium diversum]|nr:oxidoreductase [Mogibacterium diversum]